MVGATITAASGQADKKKIQALFLQIGQIAEIKIVTEHVDVSGQHRNATRWHMVPESGSLHLHSLPLGTWEWVENTNPRSSAHQRSPRVLADLRRRGRGVHVAEEVLDAPEGDAAALVAHLLTRGRRTQGP